MRPRFRRRSTWNSGKPRTRETAPSDDVRALRFMFHVELLSGASREQPPTTKKRSGRIHIGRTDAPHTRTSDLTGMTWVLVVHVPRGTVANEHVRERCPFTATARPRLLHVPRGTIAVGGTRSRRICSPRPRAQAIFVFHVERARSRRELRPATANWRSCPLRHVPRGTGAGVMRSHRGASNESSRPCAQAVSMFHVERGPSVEHASQRCILTTATRSRLLHVPRGTRWGP